MQNLLRLQAFRQAFYDALGPARDALFELCDAVLTTAKPSSFAHLSLSPLFRRQWPSLYEAIEDGRPERLALLALLLDQLPARQRPLLIGDHTAWPRLSAPTLAERTYTHHADRQTRLADGLPITAGLAFSTLGLLPEPGTRWFLPLLHERIGPDQKALQVAARQLKTVVAALRRRGSGRALALFDSQYGCARFLLLTAAVEVDLLFRLRSNRVLYGLPDPEPPRVGAPRRHGHRFQLNDPATWPEPEEVLVIKDRKLGRVELRRWHRWHFKGAHQREMTLVRVCCLDKPKKKPSPRRSRCG